MDVGGMEGRRKIMATKVIVFPAALGLDAAVQAALRLRGGCFRWLWHCKCDLKAASKHPCSPLKKQQSEGSSRTAHSNRTLSEGNFIPYLAKRDSRRGILVSALKAVQDSREALTGITMEEVRRVGSWGVVIRG